MLAVRWIVGLLAIAVGLCADWPTSLRAQELQPGDPAVVSADGDGLLLRDGPGYDAGIVELYPDGSVVAVIDGPIWAEDGSAWYAGEVDGQSGYMVAEWLTSAPSAGSPMSGPGASYRAGPECGPDESWLLDSGRRFESAAEVWRLLGDEIAGLGPGYSLDVYSTGFTVVRDEQQASVNPPAGERLQGALVTLFDSYTAAVNQIKFRGFMAATVGDDYDESGGYREMDLYALPPVIDEATAAFAEFTSLCWTT